eukprot:764242-Hanusia_phi.AAC.3
MFSAMMREYEEGKRRAKSRSKEGRRIREWQQEQQEDRGEGRRRTGRGERRREGILELCRSGEADGSS